jgi:hypothetical protein
MKKLIYDLFKVRFVINQYQIECQRLKTGFGLVVTFTGLLKQLVTTLYTSHTDQCSQSRSSLRCLVTASDVRLIPGSRPRRLTAISHQPPILLVSWGGVRPGPLGTSATNWPTVPAPDDR